MDRVDPVGVDPVQEARADAVPEDPVGVVPAVVPVGVPVDVVIVATTTRATVCTRT